MIDQKEKKWFGSPQDGGLNSDDADFSLGVNQWVNAENVRVGSTDSGVINTLESVGSTIQLSEGLPSQTFTCIGVAEDTENSRFCYFLYNTTGPWHRIMCYDTINEAVYTVLMASQVVDGLGFDKNYIIHSARVVDGLLYWTDNLNRQRKINIDAAIKLNNPNFVTDKDAYTVPINAEVISLLKRPPLNPLIISKATDGTVNNNFIANNAFEFAARYYYKDGETSVLSTYSVLANYNLSTETYNVINITFDSDEYIDQDVQRVDLIVRFDNSNNFFIIKSWDKNNPTDLAEINAQNSGTSFLTYAFYNDRTGEALDPAYALKPFDSVPIKSKTLEVAKDRLYLANNTIGYDTPITSSLSASFSTQSTGDTNIFDVLYVHWGGSPGTTKYVVYIDAPGYVGYYDAGSSPPADPTPYASLVFIGLSFSDVITYYNIPSMFLPPTVYHYAFITISGITLSIVGRNTFKSDAPYQIGIVFYDFGDRKCGVYTNDSYVYRTADRNYDFTQFSPLLNWSLSNSNAINEIPDWATHYSIVITKCLRTRFFLQTRAKNVTYVTKDINGNYVYGTTAYSTNNNGIAVDISLLNGYGFGYVYQAGDLIKIYKGSSVYTLSIKDQDGVWVICELKNIGTLGSIMTPLAPVALFEIYTPYKPSVNEPFYEVGQTFNILYSGTNSRQYSVTAGTISGDTYILQRTYNSSDFLTENMSPNDTYYKNWFTDSGRANFITNIGQTLEPNTISFSETYIAGSRVNGLSSFDALNEKPIPLECGQIQKLQLTSKVQDEQGVVMLAICEKETASLYLGEVQQYGSNAQTTLTIADQTIGTINVLKGSFGTNNPESVVEYRGGVYWVDVYNGKVIQYSANGLFPISFYKMTRFWKLFSDMYLSMTSAQIEELGGRPFIFGAVDPHHNELLFSIPKLSNTPPKGYLPDYPSTVYPFDIWDAQGKTLVYKLASDPNIWMGAYSFNPEYFISLQNKLYSFQNGILYQHNQIGHYNQFYGVQYQSKIMFVCNQPPNIVKSYNSINIESNDGTLLPSLTYFRSETPYQQASDLLDFQYTNYEGVLYATLMRNKLIPTATGYNTNGLLTQEKMRTSALKVMLEFAVTNVPLELRYVTIGFTISQGHKT